MRKLSVQFQMHRAPGIKAETISALMLRVAHIAGVRGFSFERAGSRTAYINFLFTSTTPTQTWQAIQRLALGHRRWGWRLRQSTIVTCQGSRGWDNYRLLHHFDPEQPLDRLSGV